MGNPQGDATAQAWKTSGDGAKVILKLFRQQLLDHADVPKIGTDGSLTVKSSARNVPAGELPAELSQLLERYQKANPQVRVEPICHLVFGGTGDNETSFAATDLPDEEELVVFTFTESSADVTSVEVQTHVLLARRLVE